MLHGNGIFTYIWLKLIVTVGKYYIHGAPGYANTMELFEFEQFHEFISSSRMSR